MKKYLSCMCGRNRGMPIAKISEAASRVPSVIFLLMRKADAITAAHKRKAARMPSLEARSGFSTCLKRENTDGEL